MSRSPATQARASPSSPGLNSSRRTARRLRTTSAGASGGPASAPSQARIRTGSGTPSNCPTRSLSRSAASAMAYTSVTRIPELSTLVNSGMPGRSPFGGLRLGKTHAATTYTRWVRGNAEGPPAPRMAGGPSGWISERSRSGGLRLGLLRLGGRHGPRGLVELLARVLHRAEGDDLALEEHPEGPVGEDADLAVPGRHGQTVVAAVHVPGEPALDLDLHLAHDDHRDALVQAETRDSTLVGVAVVLLREA